MTATTATPRAAKPCFVWWRAAWAVWPGNTEGSWLAGVTKYTTARTTNATATAISSHVSGRIWTRGWVDIPGETRSVTAEADVGDDDRHARGAAGEPLQVGPDGGHVLEHALQGGGDRRLPHRLGYGSVTDHESLDADREVAAHRVGPGVEADGGADEQAVTDPGQQLLLCLLPRHQAQGPGADARCRLEAGTDRRSGRGRPGATPRVGVV